MTDKSIEYSVKKERKEEKISVNLLVIYDFLVLALLFQQPEIASEMQGTEVLLT